MVTVKHTQARWSSVGQYGIQYPNTEVAGIIIPTGTALEPLSWIGGQEHQAFSWERDSGTAVVWIEKRQLE